ncbi:MAG: hypothetical protein Ta2B_13760 [Termitinemataceae bacterium]|nr:MAG: hypothetical protein Ta2B_13760 [Termitinemataceae bacterium]
MLTKKLKKLKEDRNKILFVHYSCQNLTDENKELSPRITSIAVLFNNGQVLKSFSLHYVAEILHINRDEITEKYNEIEKIMLSDFFHFAETQYGSIWLHWNMTSINYGFDALEHRYKVLTGNDAFHIDENNRYNLSKLILRRYGSKCVDDPKMTNLMKLNGGIHRDFLSGADEVKAFEAQDYLKMHKSTMCKVKWFSFIFARLIDERIKTNKFDLRLLLHSIFEHPVTQIISIVATLFTICSGVYWLYGLIEGVIK